MGCWRCLLGAGARTLGGVTVLTATHELFTRHHTGPHHPECARRLDAVGQGLAVPELAERLAPIEIVAATRDELQRVHPAAYLDRLDRIAAAGGGWIDGDTVMSADSAAAAALAAGAGLSAVAALQRGEGDAAFCAVRPPGHHATRGEAMGFCLVSNIAVVAAALADAGERVLIFDYDAHHGNGTQDVFYDDDRVLFISTHQWPFYPGTGSADEIGTGRGAAATLNIPLPAHATGDVYLAAFDEVVVPLVERFVPTWLLISAGFDAHRDDPLTALGLSSGDLAELTRRAMKFVPAGRTVAMLEGGYDFDALATCTHDVVAALAGLDASASTSETATNGGPGRDQVARISDRWVELRSR